MDLISILFQNEGMIVCVKPAGILSQAGKAGEANMISLLSAQAGTEIFPVHRLDRGVGGVMVYAKTRKAAADLSRQLQQGVMSKEYLAVIWGRPDAPEGLLTDLLFHDGKRNRTYVVNRQRKGVREAKLLYRLLAEQDGQSLVQVRLLTGRTHQIRAQFSARGTPLVGDGAYGGGRGAPQLWSMAITLEVSGRPQRFQTLPDALGCFTDLPAPLPLSMDQNGITT